MLALPYDGGQVISGHEHVLVVQAGWASDPAGELPYVQGFLNGLGTGHDRWSRILEGYPRVTYPHHVFIGTWHDRHHFPVAPTLGQLGAEADRAAGKFPRLPNLIVVILTAPQAVMQQIDNACAFHAYATTGPYIAVSYPTAGCPPTGIELSHEWAETLTDPSPMTPAWATADGSEAADICASAPAGTVRFATGVYPVAAIWDRLTRRCEVTR
jgi:hypothetical protein